MHVQNLRIKDRSKDVGEISTGEINLSMRAQESSGTPGFVGLNLCVGDSVMYNSR